MKPLSKPRSVAVPAVLALLVGVVAVPAGTTALVRSTDDTGTHMETSVGNTVSRAVADRARLAQHRRNFYDAVEVYRELLREGVTGLTRPDIGDANTFEMYLEDSYVKMLYEEQSVHASAGGEADTGLDYHDLPEWERDLIDGYVQTRFCPRWLQTNYHIEGFYDLCLQRITEAEEGARRSLMERAERLRQEAQIRGFNTVHAAGYQSLSRRLQQLDTALAGVTSPDAAIRPQAQRDADGLVRRPSLRERWSRVLGSDDE